MHDGKPPPLFPNPPPNNPRQFGFVPNHGFRNMPDSDFSSQLPVSHKLDVVVFVPVALNQFLNRPLFCVGKVV